MSDTFSASSGPTGPTGPAPVTPVADAPHPNELLGAISTTQLRNWRSLLTVTGGDQQATVNTLCAAVRALLDREIVHESRRGRDKAEAKHRATVAAQEAAAKAGATGSSGPNAPLSATGPSGGTGSSQTASSADLPPPTPPATVFDQEPAGG